MVTQLVANQLLDKLHDELSSKFPRKKVEEVLYHYGVLRREARIDHYEACLVNGGKFVEAVLKCLHYRRTGEDIVSLKAEDEIRQLESATALSDSERMTIPRTLRTIYDHRNKRGGAHNSSFDPIRMDCNFIVAASNWVLQELVRLYLTSDPLAAQSLVENLLIKDIPLVEEIDGDYLVLKPGVSARVELELILYHHFPNRCSVKDLIHWIHNQSPENVRTTLRNLKQKNLTHENEMGWRLTETGVREAEAEIASMQFDPSGTNKTLVAKKKGAKRGRR